MKVLLVNGSPNENGCTQRALQEISATLQSEGVDTEFFRIGSKPVGGCTSCQKCGTLKKCVFNDSVNEFREKAYQYELTRQFSAFTLVVKASHHMNGQQVITVYGDTAVDEHYCVATLVSPEEGKDMISINYIRYRDTLVKQDGKWLIKERDQYFLITEKRAL